MIDLGELAAPLFVDGPYIDRAADAAGALSMSHANPLRHRLYDMARESYVELAGSETDGTQIEILCAFYDEGAPVIRLVDYIHVLNHNLAGFTVEFSEDAGANYGTPIIKTGLTAADTIAALAVPQAANAVRFRATHTQITNAAKRLGGLLLGKVRLQPRVGLSVDDASPVINVVEDEMGDKTTRRAYIWHADGSNKLHTFALAFTGLTTAETYEFTELLLENPDPFIYVPEPGDDPQRAHLCEIVADSWQPRFLDLRKAAGKSLAFALREKGGA